MQLGRACATVARAARAPGAATTIPPLAASRAAFCATRTRPWPLAHPPGERTRSLHSSCLRWRPAGRAQSSCPPPKSLPSGGTRCVGGRTRAGGSARSKGGAGPARGGAGARRCRAGCPGPPQALLKDQLEVVKLKQGDGSVRFGIKPMDTQFSFDKGFYVFIRAIQLLTQHNKDMVLVRRRGGGRATGIGGANTHAAAATASARSCRRCAQSFAGGRARLVLLLLLGGARPPLGVRDGGGSRCTSRSWGSNAPLPLARALQVGLAGPSGSGKTAFSEKVRAFIPGCTLLSMDNYNDGSKVIDDNFDGGRARGATVACLRRRTSCLGCRAHDTAVPPGMQRLLTPRALHPAAPPPPLAHAARADPRITDYDTLLANIADLRAGRAAQVPIYDFKQSKRVGYRTGERVPGASGRAPSAPASRAHPPTHTPPLLATPSRGPRKPRGDPGGHLRAEHAPAPAARPARLHHGRRAL